MRKGLSIFLAALLVTLSLEQVLAQAPHQDPTTPEASRVHERVSLPVLRAPIPASESLRWRSFAEKPFGMFAEPSSSNRDRVPGWEDWSSEKRALVIVGAIVAAFVVFAVVVAPRIPVT